MLRLKNFRDKWVGSSEGNRETIIRLLGALGRCRVFIDETAQSLGSRGSGSGDSRVSVRLYSMIAEEMSRSESRGRIVRVFASSRPDLIEVDLKRPGRIDVRIPTFPTGTARETFDLPRALCRKKELDTPESGFESAEKMVPKLLTPAAAESLAAKSYRIAHTTESSAMSALRHAMTGYQPPIPAGSAEEADQACDHRSLRFQLHSV